MRGKGRGFGYRNIGTIIIFLGIFVLLALILPTSFWWFVLGAVLIAVGIWLSRRC